MFQLCLSLIRSGFTWPFSSHPRLQSQSNLSSAGFFLSFFCLHCPSNTKCHVRASNAPACERFKTSLVCLVLVEGCDGPAVPGWIQEEEGPQGKASQDTENHAQILTTILGPSLSAILGPRL